MPAAGYSGVMAHIRREPDLERQAELWSAFLDSYTTTTTRPVVDVFLRGLLGGPRHQEGSDEEAA